MCIGGERSARGVGNGLCGGEGAHQVAAVDGVDAVARQRACGLARLPEADVVERDVEMALDAGVHVPGGFSVADGDDAGDVVHAVWWTGVR
ncbi:hypothetical protein SDC9_164927 [bioreactor metagenome]|uniref:Uncharacterized protein n=1 Tax=bioreactor metagenome TaxID=1076179 RepID=A0A645FV82_9ZZZZ